MTIRIQADHYMSGPVHHMWFPDSRFGTLNLGDEGLLNTLYFDDPAGIDAVIAELTALRAEMTAGRCLSVAPHSLRRCTETGDHVKHRNGPVAWGPGVTEREAANPPHDVTDIIGEASCCTEYGGYICNAQEES